MQMAARPKAKAKRKVVRAVPKAVQAVPKTGFGDNEDAEYLDILWGILRHPMACAICGTPTRMPYYAGGTVPRCGPCYRDSEDWPSFTTEVASVD